MSSVGNKSSRLGPPDTVMFMNPDGFPVLKIQGRRVQTVPPSRSRVTTSTSLGDFSKGFVRTPLLTSVFIELRYRIFTGVSRPHTEILTRCLWGRETHVVTNLTRDVRHPRHPTEEVQRTPSLARNRLNLKGLEPPRTPNHPRVVYDHFTCPVNQKIVDISP